MVTFPWSDIKAGWYIMKHGSVFFWRGDFDEEVQRGLEDKDADTWSTVLKHIDGRVDWYWEKATKEAEE